MLKRSNRLTHHEFKFCFDTGRKIHIPVATIISTPSSRWGVAVVVPKKVKKTAVGRNRLRRIIYAAIKAGVLPTKNHYIVVVKPLPPNQITLSSEMVQQIISRINQITVQ